MFEEGVDYSENDVNQILKAVYDDHVLLRRYLLDFRFMIRSNDGKFY